MSRARRLQGALDELGEKLETRTLFYLSHIVLIYLLLTAVRAASQAFWYDELITVYLSRLPRFSDVWAAIRAGLDLVPPFQYAAMRASQGLLGPTPLGVRLVVLLFFLGMSLALYAYFAGRASRSFAMAGMMLPWLTEAYRYAVEARPYGIVLGCAAVAFWCWARACESERPSGWLAGLSASLAVALLSHCYAVLLAVPFAVGEAVLLKERRKPAWARWAALGIGGLPVGLYPAISGAIQARSTGNSPFSPTAWSAPASYGELLAPAAWPLGLALLAVVLNLRPRGETGARPAFPRHELAAAAGFLAVPVFAVLAAAVSGSGFFLRYGIVAVIGVSVFFTAAAARAAQGSRRTGAALVLLFAFFFVADFARGLQFRPAAQAVPAAPSPVPGNPLLGAARDSRLPLVIASGLVFLQADYYADPSLLSRTWYLTDITAANRFTGSAWFEVSYPEMKRRLPIRGRIGDARAFLESHPKFLLYTTGYVVEWLPSELQDRHYDMRIRERSGRNMLIEVTQP